MITATMYFDLSRDDRDRDSEAVRQLYAVEPGTRVIIFVGRRSSPTSYYQHFREYVSTLHLDIHGEHRAVSMWVDALNGRGIWGDA